MPQYTLKNTTKISSEKIRAIIDCVSPKNIKFKLKIQPMICDKTAVDGLTYCDIIGRCNVIISIRDNIQYPKLGYPRHLEQYGYTPNIYLKSQEELLVAVIAHELRHVWQFTKSSRANTYFIEGKTYSYIDVANELTVVNYRIERDACIYAKKMLHNYRKYS